ncbi:MAG TPA: branched-chain amino acid ABC transporter substrate-binding protein [Bauldia sp.]|nr:branched-chain amino acid ABC transporter substrate-binding protein [Bauldia sp.]
MTKGSLRVLAMGAVLMSVASVAHADISVGTAGPMTGANAFFGVSWMNGMDLAFKEINDAGGINGEKLVLERQDDQADPRQGTLIAQRFCDDASIVAVFGHLNSGVTIPASPIYSSCDLAVVTTSTNPRVTEGGFTNIFQIMGNDYVQGRLPANYAIDKGLKKAAVIHDKTAFGQGVADIFASSFKERGGEITSVSGVAATDVDFSAVLSTIKLEGPDVIYYGGGMPAGGLILKQARSLGIDALFIGADTVFLPDFIDTAGKDAAQGAIVTNAAAPFDASKELGDFAGKYKAVYNEEPGPYSSYGYTMAYVLADAIKRAGTTERKAIITALHDTDYDSIIGHIRFDDKGALIDPVLYLYEVDGGDFKLIGDSRSD